jgi:AraC-like DNA-binding protein
MFFDKIYRFENYGKIFWLEKLNNALSTEIFAPSTVLTPTGNKQVVPILASSMVRGHRAVLVANFSVNILRKTLQNNAIFSTSRFFVLDAGQNLIFSLGNQSEDQGEIDIQQFKLTFADGKKRSIEQTINGKSYIISYVKSDLYGWELYDLTPTSEFKEQAAGILDMIVMICVGLIVIGFIFSFIFTFKLYNPIKKIRDILTEKNDMLEPITAISHRVTDLDMIGKSVRELIEYNVRFKNEMDSIFMEYLDQMLLHLLEDHQVADVEETGKLLREKLGFVKGSYLCCNIWFHFKQEFFNEIQDMDRFIILGKLKKLIWGLLAEEVTSYVLEREQHLYICIINLDDPEQDLAAVKRALENIKRTFQYDSLYCMIHIGMGLTYPAVPGIASSYKDGMVALQHVDLESSFQIIRAADLDSEPSLLYTFADEHKILNGLKLKTADSLTDTIEEMIRNYEGRNASAHAISLLLTDIYQTGLRFLLEKGIHRSRCIPEETHRILSMNGGIFADYAEKKQLLSLFFSRLLETVSDKRQAYKSNTIVANIMNYIENNYQHDLYLENISQQFEISSKYASRIFKDKTGLNMTDYIYLIRVTNAKKLLTETELSINHIAEQVGIFSRTTFHRVFKKFEGVSPQDYRKIGKNAP